MPGPIDEVLSTTLKVWTESNAVDNIFKSHAFFWEATRGERVRTYEGGERIVEPLEYAKNTTVAPIGKAGKITLTEQDVISSAEYNWKLIAGAVVLFHFDLRRNRGEHQKINLLQTKAKNAVKSMREELLTETFSTTQVANGLLNLQSAFRDTGTLGGIDPATYTWWKSQYNDTAEPLTVEDMRNMFNKSSGGSDPPDTVLTGQVLFEKYESLLQTQQRFTDPQMADAGFQTLKHHGANVIWDEQAISDEMWFVNWDYLHLVTMPGHRTGPEVDAFTQIPDQIGQASRIWMMANWGISNRRRLGALDGRTS